MQKSRSQGNAYPGHSSRTTSCVSQKHPLNCGNAERSLACRDGEIAAPQVCQDRTPAPFSDETGRSGHTTSRAVSGRHTRGTGVQRVTFVVGEISLEYACTRSQHAKARQARRDWIVRTGEVPAELPMWTSRDGWLNEVSAWLATDDGLAECARRHIKPERVLRAAMVLAAHADHGTGRNCAVTNATVAAGAGCKERTVTTARSVLSASGLAVEIHRGTGSTSTPGYGRRPSIWHLISRPQPIDNPAVGDAVCDLPPSRRDRRLTPVRSQSPNARKRASRPNSHPPQKSPKRGRRFAPRPLHVQLLAAGVVHGSFGLDKGHIGRICDALTDSGLDLAAWTPKALLAALNADMKTRGWDWPNQVQNPRAFLTSRLQLLPVRPAGAAQGGVTAVRPERRRPAAQHDSQASSRDATDTRTSLWYADVAAVTTTQERERLLRAHEAKFGPVIDPVAALANAGRRAARTFPEMTLAAGLTEWADEQLGREPVVAQRIPPARSLSADLLMELAIGNCDCVVCGAPNAPQRPQLPLKAKSMVCDQCWPVIAAELAQASDIDEGMLA